MLAFARRQALEPETIHLPALVRPMTDILERTLGPSVTVKTALPRFIEPVMDSGELELALLNLAMNARDAMPTGGSITIEAGREVGLGPSDNPNKFICLAVTDSGDGMAMLEQHLGVSAIAKATDLSRQTIYRIEQDPAAAEGVLAMWSQ
jgi:signal transduction histidine kinase